MFIKGPGGIGKTQLLLHALAGAETARRVVWIDVERYGTFEGLTAALTVLLTDGTGTETLDALPSRLDALRACVVLDGVERFTGPFLDQLDDLLTDLKDRTVSTQFVVTSQVDMQRTLFDKKYVLEGLDSESSRELLRSLVLDTEHLDIESESALLAFVEGHPLALRLTAALVEHLGSGSAAWEQIAKKGAQTVKIHKRTKLDRKTSLDVCLSLAYEMLSGDERRLLYLIASCPAGVFTQMLKGEDYARSDAPLLVAAVRRWSLVQSQYMGLPTERTYMLSPLRSYVTRRCAKSILRRRPN